MNKLEFDYISAKEIDPKQFEVLLELTKMTPAIASAFEDILRDKYGYTVELDLLAGNGEMKLHVNLEDGSNVARELDEIVSLAKADPAIVNQFDVSINRNVGVLGEYDVTSKTLSTKEFKGVKGWLYKQIKGQEKHREKEREGRVIQIVEEIQTLPPADLEKIKLGGVDEASITSILNELGFALPAIEPDLVELANIIQSSTTHFKDQDSNESLVLNIILNKVYEILFDKFRLHSLVTSLKDGTVPADFRKLSEDTLDLLFIGLIGDRKFKDLTKEERERFAKILREVLDHSTSLTLNSERSDFLKIMVIPAGESYLEKGVVPTNEFMSVFENINSDPALFDKLSRLIGIPKNDPDLIDIYNNLKVLALLNPNRKELLDVVFKKDLKFNSIKGISSEIKELIGIRLPEYLFKNYSNQADTILFGEVYSYLRYLYIGSKAKTQLNDFLQEFARVFVKKGDLNDREVLIKIYELMKSGSIPGFDEKKLNKYKMQALEKELTNSSNIPSLAASIKGKTLELRIPDNIDVKKTKYVKVENNGSLPAVSNLYLMNQDLFNSSSNLRVIKENIVGLIDALKITGHYQSIVTLLQNSDDPDKYIDDLQQIIHNIKSPYEIYLENLASYFERRLHTSVPKAERNNTAKFLASKLVVDILAKRTRSESIASNQALPLTLVNPRSAMSKRANEIVASLTDTKGRMNLENLSTEQRAELIEELKLNEFKKQVIEFYVDNTNKLRPHTPQEKQQFLDRAAEIYGESVLKGNKKKKIEEFKNELEAFINQLLSNVDPSTGLNIDFENIKNANQDSIENLYTLLGRKVNFVEVAGTDKDFKDLDSIAKDIEKFRKLYEKKILEGKFNFTDVEIAFTQAEDGWRKQLADKFGRIRTKIDPASDLEKQFKEFIKKLDYNQQLRAFLEGQQQGNNPPLTADVLAEYEAFAAIIGSGIKLTTDEYKILFSLIRNDSAFRINSTDVFASATPISTPVGGIQLTSSGLVDLAERILKQQMTYALQKYDVVDLQRQKAEKLNEKIKEREDKVQEKDGGRAETIVIDGKNIDTKDKRSFIRRLAENMVNRDTLTAAEAAGVTGLAGLSFIATGSISAALPPLLLFEVPVGVAYLLEKRRERKHAEDPRKLEQLNDTVKSILNDMNTLPEVIRNHTRNIVLARMTEIQIQQADKDLEKIRSNIFPNIRRAVRKKKLETPTAIEAAIFPHAKRRIADAMNEMRSLMTKLEANPPTLDPVDAANRIQELRNKISEAMIEVITSLENIAQDKAFKRETKDKKGNVVEVTNDFAKRKEYKELKALENKYGSGRFLNSA